MKLDAEQLRALLPHRPPILMLEEVVDVVPRGSGTGMRRFRAEDPCFEGHFPGQPIVPGVLLIEAFAQTAMAVFLAEHVDGDPPEKLGLLAKVNEMTFTEQVVPGHTVRFSIVVDRHVGPFAFVSCEATEEGTQLVRGKLTLKIGN